MELETIAAIGPRALTPDVVTRDHLREIAKAPSFQRLRSAAAALARARQAVLRRERVSLARDSERTEFKACNGLGELYMRIPQEDFIRAQVKYGEECWTDPKFLEWYQKSHPWCRVKTTRGTRGQEYAGRGKR